MRKLLFIMLTCILFIGCNETDYSGIDPQLNIKEYTFPKEGGTLDLYSKLGYPLWAESNLGVEVTEDETSLTGSWYKVTYENKNKNLHIEVQPNETGVERKLPFTIVSDDFRCKTNYIQKAN